MSGIRHDYKTPHTGSGGTRRPRHLAWFLVGLGAPLAVLGLWASFDSSPTANPAATSEGPIAIAQPDIAPLALAEPRTAIAESPPPEIKPEIEIGEAVRLVVARGDTLEKLFRRQGLALRDLAAIISIKDARKHLTILRPGDELTVRHDDGSVLFLEKEIDEISLLNVKRSGAGFTADFISRDVERRQQSAHAVIDSSLFEAGRAANISDTLTMNMAGIFQWDVDFIQDVRDGDEFSVIYEEIWREGTKLRDGDILAAEFINRGEVYRAIRYTDGNGRSDYYTPEGRSVRKAFVRAPVDFTRISSNFNPRRRHPILNRIRAHRGVDYAAPTGTPIKAAGDGKVTFRGVKGGYGNTIILQHGGNITTLYAHLSRFAKRARPGRRVKQGEVIGFVGRSGLATAPHLHYEYRIAGVHRNPRTVKLPPADPVPAEYTQDFLTTAAPMIRQLDVYRRTRLAASGG